MANDIKVIFDNNDHFTGSLVKGKVVVTVRYRQNYDAIVIALAGNAQAFWARERGGRRNRVLVTYRNTVNYIDTKRIVWSKQNSPTNNLPIGEHTFPFECQLPQNVPPSFEGVYGWVRYDFRVLVSRGGVFDQPIPCTHLCVKARNNFLMLHREPKSIDIKKTVRFFCYNVGSITATCSLPHTGFSPGENIPINIHVENNTPRNIYINATLTRKDTFIAPRNVDERWKKTVLAITVGPPVRRGQKEVFNFNDLKIPEAAPTTIRNCTCIVVEYTLAVKVVIPWSFNRKVKIPIVVAYQPPPQQAVQVRVTPQQAVGLLCSMLNTIQQQQTQQQQLQTGLQKVEQIAAAEPKKEGLEEK